MWIFAVPPLLVLVLQAEVITAQVSTVSCPRVLCPRGPDGNPLPCTNQCRTNKDCGRGGQCCLQCGCTFCAGGVGPPPRETCQTKMCPDGQVCVEQPCQRKGKKCPRPRCIQGTPVEKPGACRIIATTCPAVEGPSPPCTVPQCGKDSECPGTQKCCISSDCTPCLRCEEPLGSPVPTQGSCYDVTCPDGQSCRPLPSPVCEKRGTCPDTSNIVSTCVVDPLNPGCGTDSDCGGALKCCPYGCQRSCLAPIADDD